MFLIEYFFIGLKAFHTFVIGGLFFTGFLHQVANNIFILAAQALQFFELFVGVDEP